MSLLCTTRFDPSLEAFGWNNAPDGTPSPYLLLAHQLDRIHRSRWTVYDSLEYTALRDICDSVVRNVNGADGKNPLKIRLIFPPSGDIVVDAVSIQPLRCDPTAGSLFDPDADTHDQFNPILSVCMDTQSTSDTNFMKTTNRQPYDDARARVGIPALGATHVSTLNHPDDVLLFNTSGAVMESSICNVAFYRQGRWLTPPLTAGCIAGVFRQWLLDNGRIYEADEHSILLDTIQNNEWVLLFNAVMGCRLGRIYHNRCLALPSDELH